MLIKIYILSNNNIEGIDLTNRSCFYKLIIVNKLCIKYVK